MGGIRAITAIRETRHAKERVDYMRVSRQVRRYIDLLVDPIAPGSPEADRDEAFLILAALVGALSMARAVDDADLSDEILDGTARALHADLHESR